MIKVSTKGRYATRIMIYLAINGKTHPVRKKEIAEKEYLSADYVEQILTKLKTVNLVRSLRGKLGGFVLAKEPKDITVADIIEATEGSIKLVDCDSMEKSCKKSSECVVRDVWKEASKAIEKIFAGYTLSYLAKLSIKKEKEKSLSFEI